MIHDSGVHCIVITQDRFGERTWEVISNQLDTLLKQGYQVRLYDDDVGIYVIQYSYHEPDLQTHELEWIPLQIEEEVIKLIDKVEKCEKVCAGCDNNDRTFSSGVGEDITYEDGSTQLSFDI